MIVAFDASILVYLLDKNAPAPVDPATGSPVFGCHERVDYLINQIAQAGGKIVIPTPALSEVLGRGGAAGPGWLRLLNASKHFRIVDFDQRAAVECAARLASRNSSLPRRSSPRWKGKFDEQIVAIASVENATVIYSDDSDIASLAGEAVTVTGIAALPLPPLDQQVPLPFGEDSDPK